MRNLRLDLCYDGTRYRGWQRQSGDNGATIQGKLEQTLGRILGEPVELTGSGRTDAGVHARHQVANFHCQSQLPCEEIEAQLRRYLPEDVGIYSCREASPRFHARYGAREKTYCYRIWASEQPCVFERRYVTPVSEALDVEAMAAAGEKLVGRHDFSAFCGNPRMKKSTVRQIFRLRVERVGPEVRVTVTGDGFLQNMVRILTGTLVEVGQGKRSAESLEALFGGKRADAGPTMPPQGLCLMEVCY